MRDKYKATVYNIGFFGEGPYKANIKGKQTKRYKVWNSMIQRCYDLKFQSKNPWYVGCEVDVKWHNYQNFAKWFEENYIEGFELDKDLLIMNNKIYGPNTCSFIPKEINNLLVTRKKSRGNYPIGVSKLGKKFLTQMSIYGKLTKLGIFTTTEEAFKCYKAKKEEFIIEISNKYKDLIPNKIYKNLINYKININN